MSKRKPKNGPAATEVVPATPIVATAAPKTMPAEDFTDSDTVESLFALDQAIRSHHPGYTLSSALKDLIKTRGLDVALD